MVRLKYLHCFTDRHGGVHYYFRYRGQRWRIPAPGTEGFATAYDKLLAHHQGQSVPKQRQR